MIVLLAGPHGRLGERILALLLHRRHTVRGLVRTESQAAALRGLGAEAVVADLRGDIEWTAQGCDAAVFAAGARHRGELGVVDAAGAAKLAEAADRYELSRFLLCSVIGAQHPDRHRGGIREFLEAKRHAERRLAQLGVPGSILRFGRLTEEPGSGRIATAVSAPPLTTNRDDAALAVADALTREHLAGQVVTVLDGDRTVAEALDAIPPRPLPPPASSPAPGRIVQLGAAQSDNPPDAADMIEHDAPPIDTDVEWHGDGPVPPEPVGNEDPAPRIP